MSRLISDSGNGITVSATVSNNTTTGCVINSVLVDGKLNVCSVNIQSIRSGCKMDEFRHIFQGSKANVIVVTESWANTKLDDSFLVLDGYRFFSTRSCRQKGWWCAGLCFDLSFV
jgi:hypothetical protein